MADLHLSTTCRINVNFRNQGTGHCTSLDLEMQVPGMRQLDFSVSGAAAQVRDQIIREKFATTTQVDGRECSNGYSTCQGNRVVYDRVKYPSIEPYMSNGS